MGEGTMERGRKMNLNEPCVFKLSCFFFKKRKTITRGKKAEEGRTKDACVEALRN